MMFSFLRPQYLFFLFAIPLLLMVHFFSLSSRKKVALKFANFDAIARIRGIDFFSKNLFDLFLSLFIAFFLIMAISGLNVHVSKETSSFSFVLAIDNSQSMDADDFLPNRLSASKQTAIDFVNELPFGVRMGVISFAGTSYIEQDLTEDKEIVVGAIKKIEIGSFGGTNLYEAVITSSNLLKKEDHKAIILLSDGQINIGSIENTIDYANMNDVIIHSIAMGTEEGGVAGYGISKVDEASLKSVAHYTGGNFFRAQDKESLSQSFSEILSLTTKKVSIDLSNYLVIFTLILFVIKFLFSNLRYPNIL